jgi:hypothetical protein
MEVYHSIHKSPPQVPILSQLDLLYTPHPISLRSILIPSSYLRLGLHSGLLPLGLQARTLYAFPSHACYMSHPPNISLMWCNNNNIIIIRGATGSEEPWPAKQPPLAVFPDCTRRYWVDMWSAHRIPQLHFQLSKPDRYFFIQVTTQFIRSRGWVDPVPDPTPSEKS